MRWGTSQSALKYTQKTTMALTNLKKTVEINRKIKITRLTYKRITIVLHQNENIDRAGMISNANARTAWPILNIMEVNNSRQGAGQYSKALQWNLLHHPTFCFTFFHATDKRCAKCKPHNLIKESHKKRLWLNVKCNATYTHEADKNSRWHQHNIPYKKSTHPNDAKPPRNEFIVAVRTCQQVPVL